ncbi:MAG TPA: peptide chain release factor N(5)-glutamine methyltransferase [Tepidimicrobium sp.]|nr:peptide chain release factor N(5)-glutamine methyltransferase [Tepidimicrobium sp.]
MEINQLLKKGVDMIKDRKYGNPVLEATMVLEELLNVDRVHIYTHGKDGVSEDVVNKFMEAMEKRSKGYPIQYIIGRKEFMGLDFYIREGVLIPRGDTEILVEYVLRYIDEKYGDRRVNVLELGIGSGAISLSIAHYNRKAKIYGVDLYSTPLEVAEENRIRLGLDNVSFYRGDLFQGIEGLNMEGKFHIIASNPPYIPSEEMDSLQEEVREYEPANALDGGEDGLAFYRRIIPESKDYLIDGGLLIFEIGYDQGKRIENMMMSEGFKDIKILKDLQGLDRVVYGVME